MRTDQSRAKSDTLQIPNRRTNNSIESPANRYNTLSSLNSIGISGEFTFVV